MSEKDIKKKNLENQEPSVGKRSKKILDGTVVSTKMKDTAVVLVGRYRKHPKYGKYIKLQKRYKVHDQGNKYNVGDKVRIIETLPISKDKHFKMLDSQ